MGSLTCSISTEDWAWLCELLADIRAYDDIALCCYEDMQRAVSCLESLEAAV